MKPRTRDPDKPLSRYSEYSITVDVGGACDFSQPVCWTKMYVCNCVTGFLICTEKSLDYKFMKCLTFYHPTKILLNHQHLRGQRKRYGISFVLKRVNRTNASDI